MADDGYASAGVKAHEIDAAKAEIDKMFVELTGKPFTAKVSGYHIWLKIYVRPEELRKGKRADGSNYTIFMPQTSQTEDKYQSIAALVVAKGRGAYEGKHADGSPKFPEGHWCEVGDWVLIPRYECHLFMYRNVAMGMLPDDRIMAVVDDPTDVQAIHLSDQR